MVASFTIFAMLIEGKQAPEDPFKQSDADVISEAEQSSSGKASKAIKLPTLPTIDPGNDSSGGDDVSADEDDW